MNPLLYVTALFVIGMAMAWFIKKRLDRREFYTIAIQRILDKPKTVRRLFGFAGLIIFIMSWVCVVLAFLAFATRD